MLKNIIYQTSLFEGVTLEAFDNIYEIISFTECHYSKGDLAPGNQLTPNAIGIIISGRIHAMKYLISGKSIYLRGLHQGEIFGVGNVFQEKDIRLSYMEVMENTHVAYIDEIQLLKLFTFEGVLKNYLVFINSKIQYLNNKIDILSQSSIRERVLMYIHDQYIVSNCLQSLELPMSVSALSEYLGVSRASLYRVFEELEKEEILRYQEGYIHLKQNIDTVY